MIEFIETTEKEKEYVEPKLSEEVKQNYYGPSTLSYLSKLVNGEVELVECSFCNGTGERHEREEWYTNCGRCDSGGVPGPPGKHPKNYEG